MPMGGAGAGRGGQDDESKRSTPDYLINQENTEELLGDIPPTIAGGVIGRNHPEPEVDSWVEMRMQRRTRIMQRRWKARLEFLLHESVLHTVVGSKPKMAAQYRCSADVSTQENIAIRVVPFEAGLPTGHVVPPFIGLDFPDTEPSVVHSEGAIGSMTFEDTVDVDRFRSLYETIRSATYDEVVSRDRIRKIARRYEQS
jgi:hypothetical protein